MQSHPTTTHHGGGTVVTSTAESLVPYWSIPGRVVLSATMIVIMATAIVGNALVVVVVSRNRGMQTRTNLFLVNLAVADFLCGCVDMPFSLVTVVRGEWIFSDVVCQMNGFATPFLFVASIHTLMYIGVFKYVSIRKPFSPLLSRRRILVMIGAAWAWAAIIATLSIVGLSKAEFMPYTTQCGPHYYDDAKSYAYFALILVSCYLVPLGIIAVCYGGMFHEILSHGRRMRDHSTIDRDKIYSQQRGILLTLFLVVLAFVVTWTPWVVYCVYAISVSEEDRTVRWVNPIVFWFGYLNSACNPVIYALRSDAFREGYKRVFGRKGEIARRHKGADGGSAGSSLLHSKSSRTETSFLQRTSTGDTQKNGGDAAFERQRILSTGSYPDVFHPDLRGDLGHEYIPLHHQPPAVTVMPKTAHGTTPAKPQVSFKSPGHKSSVERRGESDSEPAERDRTRRASGSSDERRRSGRRGIRSERVEFEVGADLAASSSSKPTVKEVHGLEPELQQWLISRSLARASGNPDVLEVYTDAVEAGRRATKPARITDDPTTSKGVSLSLSSVCGDADCRMEHDSQGRHVDRVVGRGGGRGRRVTKADRHDDDDGRHHHRHHNKYAKRSQSTRLCRYPSIDRLDEDAPTRRHESSDAENKPHKPFVFVEKLFHKNHRPHIAAHGSNENVHELTKPLKAAEPSTSTSAHNVVPHSTRL